MRNTIILGALLAMAGTGIGCGKPVIHFDFNDLPAGEITGEALKDYTSAQWTLTKDRASIMADEDVARGKVLRIEYPAGTIGPRENGGQFLIELPPAEEYWLSYRVKFEEGFDFRRGGKMPGLTSGGSKYTGGHHPTHGEGWSARYMWKGSGGAIVYFYSVDMPGKWGEGLQLPGVTFVPGRWHRIVQHIKLNAPDKSDGVLEVWFDGQKVYEDHAERFRIGDQGRIDTFYFSTFHGGNTPDWAPQNDSAARYDDIVVTTGSPADFAD